MTRDDHPSLDALAQYDAGALATNDALAVAGHLQTCADCTTRLQSIEAVRADLAALADPPMPLAVSARITRALRNEAATPDRRRRLLLTHPAAAGLAAASVIALLVVGVVLSIGTGGSGKSTSAAGRAGTSQPVTGAGIHVSHTGRVYGPQTLAAQVDSLLTPGISNGARKAASGGGTTSGSGDLTAGAGAPAPAAPAPDSLTKFSAQLSAPGEVARCLTALQAGTVALAVDVGSWQGHLATVVVVPAPNHPAQVDVYVVAAPCSATTLYYFERLPRP